VLTMSEKVEEGGDHAKSTKLAVLTTNTTSCKWVLLVLCFFEQWSCGLEAHLTVCHS